MVKLVFEKDSPVLPWNNFFNFIFGNLFVYWFYILLILKKIGKWVWFRYICKND